MARYTVARVKVIPKPNQSVFSAAGSADVDVVTGLLVIAKRIVIVRIAGDRLLARQDDGQRVLLGQDWAGGVAQRGDQPGAVGVLFMGANVCSLDNLTVRSGDGAGHAGLWFPTWAVQGYFNDITVHGFDHGIELLNSAEVSPAIEWVTLKGQKRSAIHVAGSCPSLRKISSENSVPALRITGAAAHVTMLDSRLARGDRAAAAIVVDHPEAQLFVRDIETSGYGAAVDCAESLRRRGSALAIPPGTTARASFATSGDGGPDKLLDGNPDTFLAGAPNTVKAPREPAWVDIVFPAPVADLAGIELGGAERFGNYYAKEIEIWADSDGDRTFETPLARIAGLGGGGKQSCLLDFGGRLPSVSALRLLVVEQNRTGSNRAFHMNGIALTVLLSQLPQLFGVSVDAEGPLRQFWWRFVTLRGYRDGLHGLRLSLLMAYYEFETWRRTAHLWKAEPPRHEC